MSRRKKFSPFVAFTATAALTLSTVPAFAAENASPALEETPEVQEIQDSQDILDSLAESGGVTVTLTLTEPLCSILTDSLVASFMLYRLRAMWFATKCSATAESP